MAASQKQLWQMAPAGAAPTAQEWFQRSGSKPIWISGVQPWAPQASYDACGGRCMRLGSKCDSWSRSYRSFYQLQPVQATFDIALESVTCFYWYVFS